MTIRIDTPLDWPTHQARTPRARQSNMHGFSPNLTIEDALRFLDDELAPLNPILVIVSTHIEHFASERLRKLDGVNTAMAIKIKCASGTYHFGCDRWLSPQHNLYAMQATLRQMRQIETAGILSLSQLMGLLSPALPVQTAALQAVAETLEPWRMALGLGPSATLADANAVYRARAKSHGEHHPEALATLNEAVEQARKHLPSGSAE